MLRWIWRNKIPQHWWSLTNDDAVIDLSFLGGGPRRNDVACSAKDADQVSNVSSWLKPCKSDRSQSAPKVGKKPPASSSKSVGSSWLQPRPSASDCRKRPRTPEQELPSSSWIRPAASARPSAPRRTADQVTIAEDLAELDELIQNPPQMRSRLSWDGSQQVRFHLKETPRFRIWGKQNVGRYIRTDLQEWACPERHMVFKSSKPGALSKIKIDHLKSRHPHFDLNLVKTVRIMPPVCFSEHIPEADRDFSCPLCAKGVYAMPRQDRRRAMAHHCATVHPEHTSRSLTALARKGKKQSKDGVVKMQLSAHNAYRQEKWASHDCLLTPREAGDHERGRLNFCRRCLSRLGQGPPHINAMSCDERLNKLTSNPWVKKMKRDWWERVQLRDPQWSQLFLDKSGWTMMD